MNEANPSLADVPTAAEFASVQAESFHLVTIRLTPHQMKMVREVMDFDGHETAAEFVLHEVEGSVVCYREGLASQRGDDARAEWETGKETA